MTPREMHAKASFFAMSRVSADTDLVGEDFAEALKRGYRWFPKVGGKFVRNSDDPEFGFDSREAAIASARKYRESCRQWLKDNAPTTDREE